MSALIGITRRYQLSDRDGATFGAATGDDVLAQLCADRRAMREGGDVQGLAYVVASAADERAPGTIRLRFLGDTVSVVRADPWRRA